MEQKISQRRYDFDWLRVLFGMKPLARRAVEPARAVADRGAA